MRILHIVALVTPDGAYGGPVRVAMNQTAALHQRGHTVKVAAAASGFPHRPTQLGSVPAELFASMGSVPGLGFASTWAPRMRSWLNANASQFDIAHVHLGRDLVTLPAALQLRRLRIPYVCQTHGMIRARSHRLAPVIDRVWTNKLLRDAAEILCLDEREHADLIEIVGPDCNYELLPNGVPPASDYAAARNGRNDDIPEVLFLSRLHKRKHPEVFAEAALDMLRSGMKARFAIVGINQGAETAVDRVIDVAREEGFGENLLVREPGLPPEDVNERLSRASVYVLPAEREPFGLTVAEALSVGTPVVIRDDGGLANFVRRHNCGLCVSGTAESIHEAVSYLLANPTEAEEMGQRGAAAVKAELSSDSVAARLESIYQGLDV